MGLCTTAHNYAIFDTTSRQRGGGEACPRTLLPRRMGSVVQVCGQAQFKEQLPSVPALRQETQVTATIRQCAHGQSRGELGGASLP